MKVFQKSNWIWDKLAVGADTYCEFVKQFDYDGEKCFCNLSCDSDYTLFVNGKFVESNQYPDFEHYKIYDQIDITPYLKKGNNKVVPPLITIFVNNNLAVSISQVLWVLLLAA